MNIKYITNFCFCLFFLSTSLFSSCLEGDQCYIPTPYDSKTYCNCEDCAITAKDTFSRLKRWECQGASHTDCAWTGYGYIKCICSLYDLDGNACGTCGQCSGGTCHREPTMCTNPCTECKGQTSATWGLPSYNCVPKEIGSDCSPSNNPCTIGTCQDEQCLTMYTADNEPPPVGSCPSNDCARGICLDGQCAKGFDQCISNSTCTVGYCEVNTCRTLDLTQYNCCENVNDCQNYPKREVPNPTNPSQRIEIDDQCYIPTCYNESNHCEYIKEDHYCCSEQADCKPYNTDCFNWECVINGENTQLLNISDAANGTTGICWHEKISEDCCTEDEDCKPKGETTGMTWWCDNGICQYGHKDLSCKIDDDCRPPKPACLEWFCDLDAEDTSEGEGICRELAHSSDCDPCTPLMLAGNMTRVENNFEKCEVYLSWVVPYVDNEDQHFCDEIRFFDVEIQDQRRKWRIIEDIPYDPDLNDQSNEAIQTLTGEYVGCWPDQHDFKVLAKDEDGNHLAFARKTLSLKDKDSCTSGACGE